MVASDTTSAAPRSARRLQGRTLVLGAVLGGAALWLSFRGLDADALRRALRTIHPAWALAALASTMLSLVLLTWRWRLLFFPAHRERRFWPLFRAIVVGQMLNIVLPLRLGEIGRMYVAAHEERLSKSRVLATLAVEKALDLGMFGLAVALTLTQLALPEGVGLRRSAQWVIAAGGLAALWLVSRQAERLATLAARLTRLLPARVAERASGIAARFLDGLGSLRDARGGLAAMAWSVAVVASAALTNYLLLRAFGWRFPPLVALFLLVLIQAGFVPPSLPGKIGIFHYMVVVGLGAFGVERGPALAYAWALYVVALVPKVLLGAAFVAAGHRPGPVAGLDEP